MGKKRLKSSLPLSRRRRRRAFLSLSLNHHQVSVGCSGNTGSKYRRFCNSNKTSVIEEALEANNLFIYITKWRGFSNNIKISLAGLEWIRFFFEIVRRRRNVQQSVRTIDERDGLFGGWKGKSEREIPAHIREQWGRKW